MALKNSNNNYLEVISVNGNGEGRMRVWKTQSQKASLDTTFQHYDEFSMQLNAYVEQRATTQPIAGLTRLADDLAFFEQCLVEHVALIAAAPEPTPGIPQNYLRAFPDKNYPHDWAVIA